MNVDDSDINSDYSVEEDRQEGESSRSGMKVNVRSRFKLLWTDGWLISNSNDGCELQKAIFPNHFARFVKHFWHVQRLV